MSEPTGAPDARKRPTNLSVNADLLRQARELGINLSQALEDKLAELIRERRRAAWLEANRAGIGDYNERVARDGLFGDEWRTF